MTICIDDIRIKHDVAEYYRYGMFSHEWEDNEPLFEQVIHMVVYELEESPTHDKLKMFCKIVQDAGLQWAWSDTCCINKADHFVLEEALVAMSKWYQRSALTVVFLFDVLSPSRYGNLMRCIWNTLAWTFQESKVVRFYTKDWKLHMNLDIPDHAESPEIIWEMEEATSVSAQALMAHRPCLDIPEKLCLASIRRTTLVEDAAYSLLGIFSMLVYGEGDLVFGRVLAQLLTSSGDTGILSWTGKSGSFNSCLPSNITVFKQLSRSHIPPVIPSTEMHKIVAKLRASSLNLTLVMSLHDRLDRFTVASFSGQRMTLLCLTFKLGAVTTTRSAEGCVFRAQADALGIVSIRTEEDLSQFNSLYLVHPWIDFLLDRRTVGSIIETIPEQNIDDQSSSLGNPPSFAGPSNTLGAAPKTRTGWSTVPFAQPFAERSATPPKEAPSPPPPSPVPLIHKEMRALCVIARLSQPFGALLLTPNPGGIAYRRVSAETLITVKLEEITPAVLKKLVSSVRVLEVL